MDHHTEMTQRLATLVGYHEIDPENLTLLRDICATAMKAQAPECVLESIARYQGKSQLPDDLLNSKGLAFLQLGLYADAVNVFEALRQDHPTDVALRFNMACALSMISDDSAVLELLDQATLLQIDGAAALKVQMLHRLSELDEALQLGMAILEKRPQDQALQGALALVALDTDQPDLARSLALQSPGSAEGLSTLGMLSLQDYNVSEAEALFDKGLTTRPDSARNLLGKGLALLGRGEAAAASDYLERSAVQFGTHLGSWVAAGWAHYTAGNTTQARAVFERALDIDDTFSETHGALAVLDVLEGRNDQGRRNMEIALRLDPESFAGRLAQTLLLEQGGEAALATRLRDRALNTPLNDTGQTLAQAMIALVPWSR